MTAKTDKRFSYFISELKETDGGPLHFFSRTVMPHETHRDAQYGTTARHSAPQHWTPAAGFSCTATSTNTFRGFFPGRCLVPAPHQAAPTQKWHLGPSLPLGDHSKLQLGSLKYTQTFNHPQLFPRFFIPPDIEFCHSWNNWSSEKLLHPELPALQEFIVSSKIVSASVVPVVYLSFEENTSTQASYDHLTLQTLVGIDSWSSKFTQSIKYTPLLMKHTDHLSSVTLLWQKEGRCQRVLSFNISASWSILRPQSWAWNCLR